MPLVRVTYQKGAFTKEQKDRLAEGITHAVLIGEIGADTEFGRPVANVIFTEVDASSDWYVAGVIEQAPPKGGRYMIDTVFPLGSSPQAAKTEFHKAIQHVLDEVLGVDGSFPNRAGDWVMIHEIQHGNWGFSGRTMGSAEIGSVVKAAPQRLSFTNGVLAGYRKLRELAGMPAGTGPE